MKHVGIQGSVCIIIGRHIMTQVAEDAEDGILYMDAGAGEAFHFNGGLPSLLELGARAICSLENASPLDAVGLFL